MLASDALPIAKPTSLQAAEMPHMMLALGIEPAFVQSGLPAIFAGMESVCASCGSKETCRKDLAAHEAPRHFADYCGNAATISLLADRPDLAAE